MRDVVVLAGPPCGGKTTEAHQLNPDSIIDYDDIARELGSPARWLHPEPWRTRAETETRRRIDELAKITEGVHVVIRTAPTPRERAYLAKRLDATVKVIDPGIKTCLERARRDQRPAGTDEQIRAWYRRYKPWNGDAGAPTVRRGNTTVRRRHHERLRKPGATCGLCGKPIDLTRTYPDPWSFAVHHATPIAAGGPDEPNNTMATHKLCNERQGSEVTPRILRRSQTLATPPGGLPPHA